MPNNCGLITAGFDVDCTNPILPGVKDNFYVFNIDDIDSLTYGATKETISAIVLATAKTAFIFEGKNDSIDPKSELEKARFSTNHNHEIIFRIFDNSVAVKQQLNKLINGKYTCVVENVHVNANVDSTFEVYGELSGLEVAELNRMPSDVESEGGWFCILRTPERSKEPRVPATFLDTDYQTSKDLLDGYL